MPDNGPIKTFVVDTNVLLHNPNAIFLFADNDVIIPFDVIEELDSFKTNNDDLGRNARQVIRHLDRLRERGNLSKGIDVKETGGSIRVILEQDQKLCPGVNANTRDNRIICCAFGLKQAGKRVVFVSKDINARIKADTMGVKAEDFENQKVDFERLYTGYQEVKVPGSAIDALFQNKQLKMKFEQPVYANEYVLLKDESDESHTALSRYRADLNALVPIRSRRGPIFGIMPRNLQQTRAIDQLLDDWV
jgi:PhoH-like ATPase